MVKDANEARCLTIDTHSIMIKEANVDPVLAQVTAACKQGQYCQRIYGLISVPEQLKLNGLGFTVEPGEGGDCPPNYLVSWYKKLHTYQEVILNG